MICAKTGLRIQLVAVSYLLMLLAACSRPVAPVATEWIIVKEDTTPTGHRFVTYAGPTTISKSGNTARMSSVIDSEVVYGAASDRPRVSWKDEWEYDCQDEQHRPLQFAEYSGRMGTGEKMFSHTMAGIFWIRVNPGSVGEALWKMACGKE